MSCGANFLNWLTRPTLSRSLLHKTFKSESSSSEGTPIGGAEDCVETGAGWVCEIGAGSVSRGRAEEWARKGFDGATEGFEAGTGMETTSLPLESLSFCNCFRTESRLTALRASIALRGIMSRRIFFDEESRRLSSASPNISKILVKPSWPIILDWSARAAAFASERLGIPGLPLAI